MFEVGAVGIRGHSFGIIGSGWGRRRFLCLALLGLKNLIFCFEFLLFFSFLANPVVKVAPPSRKWCDFGLCCFLEIFLQLQKGFLFIRQIFSALNKVAIVGLQFDYFLLGFSVCFDLLLDLLLQ